MNVLHPPVGSPVAASAPVFTLGSALRWLGHDCPVHRCWEPIAAMNASVWFIRRGPQYPMSRLESLVVVEPTDIGEPPARVRRLIHEIDCCTGKAIHVRRRGRGNNRHAMIAVPCGSPTAGRSYPRLATVEPTSEESKEPTDDIWALSQTAAATHSLEQLLLHAFTRWNRTLSPTP